LNFTAEQERAIGIRNSDILVSAGAGSGKTTMLVERIIRLVTGSEPVDIDRLLVVTFTEAAASSMRAKVAAALNLCVKMDPTNAKLREQMARMNKANITTIHAFCLKTARRFFHKIDMDPNFRVADHAEVELLKAEILDKLFEEEYQKCYYEEEGANADFVRLAEIFDRRVTDDNFRRLVLEVFEFSRSCPNPEQWLMDAAAEYRLENGIQGSAWYDYFKRETEEALQAQLDNLMHAQHLAENCNIHAKYREVLAQDIDNIEDVKTALNQGFEAFSGSLDFSFTAFTGAKSKDADGSMSKEEIDALKAEIKALREGFKKLIGGLRDLFIKNSDDMAADLTENYGNIIELIRIVSEFGRRYQDEKKERNIADFADFEHFCLKIFFEDGWSKETALSPEAMVLQDEFDEVFIDEYQDVSLLQEVILSAISGQNRLMVGDVKQCIYQFRKARPDIFVQTVKRFLSGETPGEVVNLAENFRSRKEIINAVNRLFCGLMSEKAVGVEYDEAAMLKYAAGYDDADSLDYRTVLHLVDNNTESSEDDSEAVQELAELSSAEAEAEVVARHIKQLMGGGIAGQARNDIRYRGNDIRYRDIVVLMRSTTAAEVFAERLREHDIPAFSGSDAEFFLATEVMVMLALLQIIDNSRQDIPLITVLHSAIFRFSSDDLVQIRRTADGDFFNALTACAAGDGDISAKADAFIKRLGKWRDDAGFMPISGLISMLYNETGFYNYVGVLPGGNLRRANLMMLFEKAAKYEKTSFSGLFGFIRYIEKLQKNNYGFEKAKITSENEDLVRIMTIHKSKGLEFPVVFVVGLGKKFNLRDKDRDFVMNYDLRMGMKAVNLDKSTSSNTFARHVVGRGIVREQVSEEMRILYVAMTRAMEKLYLVGTTNVAAKSRYAGGLRPYDVAQGRSFLQWIMMAIGDIDKENEWDIKISNKLEFDIENQRKQREIGLLSQRIGQIAKDRAEKKTQHHDEVFRRLLFEYPHQVGLYAPAKMSVSEVKRLYYREFIADSNDFVPRGRDFLPPKFLRETAENAATKGIAVHTVLEHVDLFSTNKDDVLALIKQLVAQKVLSEEEAQIVPVGGIVRFLASDVVLRMRQSVMLKREVPFAVAVPPGVINSAFVDEEGDEMVLHGVVDCVFEEDGGLVVVDYKTERVSGGGMAAAEAYRPQMELYQYALEKVFKKKVLQRIIYFFDGDLAVEV